MDEIISLIDKTNLDLNSLNDIIDKCKEKSTKIKVDACCELLKTKSVFNGLVELITDFNFEFQRIGYRVKNSYKFSMGDVLCKKTYSGDNEGYGKTCISIIIDKTQVFNFVSEDYGDEDYELTDYITDKSKLLKYTKSIKMNYKKFIENVIEILDELEKSKYRDILNF